MPRYTRICPGLPVPGTPTCRQPALEGARYCASCQLRLDLAAEAADDDRGLVHCSVCDGVGHGQPGYGPCPLEDQGWRDTLLEESHYNRAFG